MAETRGKFNIESFYKALDSVRINREITWKQIAEESGVPASTLTRMSSGKRPDVDSLSALADWSGLNPIDFMSIQPTSALFKQEKDPLGIISSCLHNDPNLDSSSANAIDILVKTTYEQMRKNNKKK